MSLEGGYVVLKEGSLSLERDAPEFSSLGKVLDGT